MRNAPSGRATRPLVDQRPHAQHAVEAFAHQVHQPIGTAQLQLDQRMRLHEFRQPRQHEQTRHAAGHVHAQPTAQRLFAVLEHRLQVVHVGQQVFAALVKGVAVVRQLHLARGPVQQPRAQRGLELLHRGRSAGLGNAQAVRRAGEAGQLGHAVEDLHGFDRMHARRLLRRVGIGRFI
jgi:hypothetical protein